MRRIVQLRQEAGQIPRLWGMRDVSSAMALRSALTDHDNQILAELWEILVFLCTQRLWEDGDDGPLVRALGVQGLTRCPLPGRPTAWPLLHCERALAFVPAQDGDGGLCQGPPGDSTPRAGAGNSG